MYTQGHDNYDLELEQMANIDVVKKNPNERIDDVINDIGNHM